MAQARAKPKVTKSGLNITLLGGLIAVVVLCTLAYWYYFSVGTRQEAAVNYASIGPMVVRNSQFSVKTTLAVQTSKENKEWALANKKELEFAVQTALTGADVEKVLGNDRLPYLRTMLRDTINASLKTDKVEDVLVTDFIVQSE